jgi:hypothetical protein
MRHLLSSIAVLALAANFATAGASPASARPSPWNQTIHCSQPGGACVGTSAGNYNSCVELGLERGFNRGKATGATSICSSISAWSVACRARVVDLFQRVRSDDAGLFRQRTCIRGFTYFPPGIAAFQLLR